jgi:hypothetical protein
MNGKCCNASKTKEDLELRVHDVIKEPPNLGFFFFFFFLWLMSK